MSSKIILVEFFFFAGFDHTSILTNEWRYRTNSRVKKSENVHITQHWGAFANNSCRGKAISIIYRSVCACVWVPGRMGVCMRIRAFSLVFPARDAYAPYCDVTVGPSVSCVFFDIISHAVRFSEKNVTGHKMCFDILHNFFAKHFSF